MEPAAVPTRPSPMRPIARAAAALLLPLSLAACGSGDDDVATDPATDTASTSSTPSPTAAPTVGTYPAFEPEDYTFELSVSCFCPGAGVPIEVTVVDAQVVGAVYGMDDGGRGGAQAGDEADQHFWLSINDVIDEANDTSAASVEVDWPAGQDYPNSVHVDHHKDVADDEVGYTVADVQVTG